MEENVSFILSDDYQKKITEINKKLSKYTNDLVSKLSSKYPSSGLDALENAKIQLKSHIEDSNDWFKFTELVINITFCAEVGLLSKINTALKSDKFLCEDLGIDIESAKSTLYNNIDVDLKSSFLVFFKSLIDDSIKFDDYISNKKYEHDIDVFYNYFYKAESDDDWNQEVLKDIKYGRTGILDNYQSIKAKILECFGYIYSNTFGLYPYQGVFSFFGQSVKQHSFSVGGTAESHDFLARQNVRTGLAHRFSYKVSNDLSKKLIELAKGIRSTGMKHYYSGDKSSISFQSNDTLGASNNVRATFFDLKEILNSSSALYYPCEVFEFATGSQPIVHKSSDAICYIYFDDSADIHSWDAYVNGKSLKKDTDNQSISDDIVSLDSKIDELLSKYIYLSMEKNSPQKDFSFKWATFNNDDSVLVNSGEISDTFDSRKDFYESFLNGEEGIAKVKSDLVRFIKTLCSAVILTRNDLNSYFKVKFVCYSDENIYSDIVNGSDMSIRHDIFDHHALRDTKDSNILDDTYYPSPSRNYVDFEGLISCVVAEYSFCPDLELKNAKPLWGYQAARLFQQNGQKIDNANILLGEGEDGTPIFASMSNPRIPLQKNVFHRVSAGSRSGKGVMTMNIMASALASDTAVFYLDRKPDMIGVISHISPYVDLEHPGMFISNGGLISSGDDVFGSFKEGSKDECELYKRFCSMDKSILDTPVFKKFQTKSVWSDGGNKGSFGDFIYAKTMIFMFGVLWARIAGMTTESSTVGVNGKEDLYINGNVMFIFDEITNWHNNFEKAIMPMLSKGDSGIYKYYDVNLGKESQVSSNVDYTTDEDYMSCLRVLDLANEVLEEANASGDNKKIMQAEKTVNTARKALKKSIKDFNKEHNIEEVVKDDSLDLKLYITTYFDKLTELKGNLMSVGNAGDNPVWKRLNDVYYIGQRIAGLSDLPSGGIVDSTDLISDKSKFLAGYGKDFIGTNALSSDSKGSADDFTRSPMLNFAETLSCDWFIGRNYVDKVKSTGYSSDFGGVNQPKDIKQWLHDDGNWIYIPAGLNNQEYYKGGQPNWEECLKIKPYLVLNTNDEMDGVSSANSSGRIESPYLVHHKDGFSGKYKYIFDSAKRVSGDGQNLYVDKLDRWEELRLQWVKDPEVNRPSKTNPCYGKLEDGIGLKGLIVEYKRTSDPGYEFNQDTLSLSGKMANAICRKFGYKDYIDFLLDLSPSGFISGNDIVAIYRDPSLQCQWNADGTKSDPNREKRLGIMFSRYKNTNNMSLLDSSIKDSDDVIGVPEDVLSEQLAQIRKERHEYDEVTSNNFEDNIEPNTGFVLNPNFGSDNESISGKATSDMLKQIYSEQLSESDENDYDEDGYEEDYDEDNYDEDNVHTEGTYNLEVDIEEIRREAYEQGYADAYVKVKKILEMYVDLLIQTDSNTAHLKRGSEDYNKLCNMFINMILGS